MRRAIFGYRLAIVKKKGAPGRRTLEWIYSWKDIFVGSRDVPSLRSGHNASACEAAG